MNNENPHATEVSQSLSKGNRPTSSELGQLKSMGFV